MHLHILGIGGTFMGGLAQLAQAAGHRVSGCDSAVYPPMSDQLAAAGIDLIEGFEVEQLSMAPDLWVVGNVVTRGNPLMEAILDQGGRFTSGPQWLAEHVLHGRHVLGVAGTHGKTTTTAMLGFILESAGLAPGFLVGGVPQDFDCSARLTDSAYFVIEADEYDTAFFDKRSKFIHYRPRTAVLNNLEFDHADIFPDLDAIETQFHHLVRTLPASARIVVNADEAALDRVLARGCYSELERFGPMAEPTNDERATGQRTTGESAVNAQATREWTISDTAPWFVSHRGRRVGELGLDLPGAHNRMNALAAIAAAHHVGVAPERSLDALLRFRGVKRRLEVRGEVNGVTLIDDFAHHPTAIAATIAALRCRAPSARLVAVLEPRSNTMKQGVIAAQLAVSLAGADRVFCYAGGTINWDVGAVLAPLGARVTVQRDFAAMIGQIVSEARSGDQLLVMSNGGFQGIHGRLLERLAAIEAA